MSKIKEMITYLLGTVGVSIFSFILSILYSRFFIPADYGMFSLTYSIYNLGFQFFTGWMTHSILRFYSLYNETEKKEKILLNTILFTLIFAGVLYSVLTILGILLFSLNTTSDISLLIFSIVFYFEGALLIFNTFLRSSGQSKQYSKNITFNSLGKSLVLLVLYYIFNIHNVLIIVISLFISDFAQTIYLVWKLKITKSISINLFNKNLFFKLIKYGFPLLGTSLIFWVIQSSDKFIISFFKSSNEVGLYSYGYQMGFTLFYTFTNAIMLGAYPRITEAYIKFGKKQAESVISKYMQIYLYMVAPAVIGIVFTGKDIIYLICDEQYWACYPIFIITCISFAVFGLIQYTNKSWELSERTEMILKLNIMSAVINVIINFIFIPQYGYIIGAISTLVSFLVHIVISLILSRGFITYRIPFKYLRNIIVANIVMINSILLFKMYFTIDLARLFIMIIFAAGVYFFILLILKDENLSSICSILLKRKEDV